ncbi:MAG: pyruvate formate lyase family protein, partial [Dehalococcoidales bacterium]
MAIAANEKNAKSIGSWQELFVPKTTERVKRLRENAIRTPEICLERVRTEMKIGDKYDKEPRILQRAYFYRNYLKEKTVFIADDELIVGNINSKVRGSTIEGSTTRWLE